MRIRQRVAGFSLNSKKDLTTDWKIQRMNVTGCCFLGVQARPSDVSSKTQQRGRQRAAWNNKPLLHIKLDQGVKLQDVYVTQRRRQQVCTVFKSHVRTTKLHFGNKATGSRSERNGTENKTGFLEIILHLSQRRTASQEVDTSCMESSWTLLLLWGH